VIELQLDIRGAERILEGCRTFQRQVSRGFENALRRGVRRALKDVNNDIRNRSGLGRSIWGKKGKGLKAFATLIRPRREGEMVETGIKFRGLAALIEKGGRIAPHKITPVEGGKLIFEGRSGRVFAKVVNHPGAPVRAHGYGRQAVEKHAPAIAAEVNESVGKVLQEAFSRGF